MSGLTEWLKGFFSLQQKKANSDSQTGSITVQRTEPQRLLLTVRGIVSRQQITAAQQRILTLAGPDGRWRGLIQAEEFTGFAPGAAGGMAEIERMYAVDEVMERFAVVADRAKHDDLNMFLGGWMREAKIKFFAPSELGAAGIWLES